jgi:hypothetical protein
MGMLSSALFNPAVVNGLYQLTEEGAASLLVRDALMNYGQVSEAKKENEDLANEVSLNVWGAWVTWGSGFFLLKSLYFNVLNTFLPFSKNADNWIMEGDKGCQQLTDQKAKTYSQTLHTRFTGKDTSVIQQAGKLAQGYEKIATKDAQTFLKQMNFAKIGGILLPGGIAAFLTGWVIPQVAHHRTKKKLRQKAAEMRADDFKQQQLNATDALAQDAPSKSLTAQWQHANALLHTNAVTSARQTRLKQQLVQARLGKTYEPVMPRSAVVDVVDYLNKNPNITNLLLVDSVITGSRVGTAEDNNDRIRWATFEAIFLYMMYFGSAQVREMIQQGVMDLPKIKDHALLKNLNYNSLAVLQRYAQKGESQPQMKQAFATALDEFGITAEQLEKLEAAFEQYTAHHTLMAKDKEDASQQKLKVLMEPIIESISTHMQKSSTLYKPNDNVIVDLLMSEGVMPIHQEGFFSALTHGRLFKPTVFGIDLTQAMPAFDEAHGEKGVANVIYRLSQLAKKESTGIGHQVMASYFGHTVGIVASLVGGYLVMGRLSPWVQRWLSHKVTGQSLPNRMDINNYTDKDEQPASINANA